MHLSGYLKRDDLQQLFQLLQDQGYRVIGPRLDSHAIVYDEIRTAEQLPSGMEVRQAPGRYELHQREHGRHFSWANTAQTIKPLTFAPNETLWTCQRDEQGNLQFQQQLPEAGSLAVIGARACDLAALKLQQQHFLNQHAEDPWFKQRFGSMLIIAVHCSHAADTCFCHATGDGPEVRDGYDIAMHELDDGYLLEAASYTGETLAKQLPLSAISQAQQQQADDQLQQCRDGQSRTLPSQLQHTLMARLEHQQWEKVGERCLSCGNCTAVCPTCFCHQQHDDVSLADDSAVHYRQWSSCFSHNHGYLSGFSLRPTPARRYRQWLTHKFGSWHDQYGRSGCVGCGRCISWCPVGIDVTEELHAICDES